MIEQQIFLGGQVSHEYPVFQEMAKMSPEYAEAYELLKMIPDLEALKDDPIALCLKLLELFGEVDFLRSCSELTRLSMIMGDKRVRTNVRGAMDELRKARSDSPT